MRTLELTAPQPNSPAFTFQPRLACNNRASDLLGDVPLMRGDVAMIGLLALGGCASEAPIEQPTMYLEHGRGR